MKNIEEYFFEAFSGMERLGPGSSRTTINAIRYIDRCKSYKVLDIGCGVGAHTFILANELPNADIIAIDNNVNHIRELNTKANEYGLADRVKGICMSMLDMKFEEESFDLIWAEGSIYIAGFTKGLADWRKYLRKNGMFICSEISWLVDNPSWEIKEFWQTEYPEINTIENKLEQARSLGYKEAGHFICGKEYWLDNYYLPLESNLKRMRVKYEHNNSALHVLDMLQREINLYNKFWNEYSYVFYVLQRL